MLQPAFAILHTLTTARAPSPIVNLAWHASSSKQKSDMLATQTLDGDLRVWSIAKPATAEPPKTIRILKRGDNVEPGLNWLAWSKNGRVLQFSDGEMWSWDVRTKHVQCEPIPTVEGVRGLANWGSQATLFTLGPNNTVQQYELSPPRMVKQVQFSPAAAQTPSQRSSKAHHIPGTAPPMNVQNRSESQVSSRSTRHGSERSGPAGSLSMIQRTANEMSAIEQARQARADMTSPGSTASRTDTVDSMASHNRSLFARQGPVASISSRAHSGTTFSTMSPSMLGRDSMISGTSMYPSTYSLASSGRRSRGSRLRQEVLRSPESHYIDLFPRTRSRLASVAHKQPAPIDQDTMSPDDLRKQMLDLVFGWEDDIEPLIRDELFHHTQGSPSAVLLAKWLGEVDSDMMAAAISSGNVNSSDWMVLALSSMSGNSAMSKMGQAFVQRLLQQGDFHTSATILLGMGDLEDAVEVYVSRCFYMEAILLTSLVFPQDWQRQAHLVQKWGEFVVENSQQNLAMRCFYATGLEPPLPWGSPAMTLTDSQSRAPSTISDMLSPPLSPPLPVADRQRGPSLKVITSFEKPLPNHNLFPGLHSSDHTPTNPRGVTPIAESALSPGGTPGGYLRNPLRLSNRAITPGGGNFMRQRLPSIGESSVDVTLPPFKRPSQLPTPDNSGSDLEKEKERHVKEVSSQMESEDGPPPLLSSARYDPSTPVGPDPQTAVPQTTVRTTILPSPARDAFTQEKVNQRSRNASRDRKPEGLHIRMPSEELIQTLNNAIPGAATSLARSGNRRSAASNSVAFGGPLSGGLSTGGLSTGRLNAKSPSLSGASAKSPSISSRSIDQYISSLDEARSNPRKYKSSSRKKSRSKHRASERSEDRGRESRDTRRYVRPAKRSPSSPVPMSPEHYTEDFGTSSLASMASGVRSPDLESRSGRSETEHPRGLYNIRSGSKASDFSHRTVRHRSPEAASEGGIGSKSGSRQPSPRAMPYPDNRGRSKSKGRNGSGFRSPSSPLSFSPNAKQPLSSDSEDNPLRLVEANRQRIRSRHRSGSRKPKDGGAPLRTGRSQDRRHRNEDRSTRASETDEQQSLFNHGYRRFSGDQSLPESEHQVPRRQKSVRTQKKELAQAELAARRESLLRNPEAPVVPHPSEFSKERPNVFTRSQTDLSNSPTSWNSAMPSGQDPRIPNMSTMVDNSDMINRSGAASVGPYGLPSTPRAMRHPRYDNKESIPAVPEFPGNVSMLPETYYTKARDLPRSMSAPIPEPKLAPTQPSELPPHPAFHKGLKQENRISHLQPLATIGQHRRKVSGDQQAMMHPQVVGIDETLHAAEREDPPILPELQHLTMAPPPPPPPPPPPAPFGNHDADSSSLSSNSHVGMIQMVLDNEPEDEANVIEVPPKSFPAPAAAQHYQTTQNIRRPSVDTTSSPPPSVASRSSSSHRRGRSGENYSKGIKGITERLRSSSRGRMTKSPEQATGPSPYESVPPLYF